MLNNKTLIHFNIYFGLLIVFAISLSLIPYFVSAVQFLLPINWIIEGGFRKKMQRLKSNWGILLIISIVFVHLIGLVYSKNLSEGLEDIKIKLPLLILPLIIGTSQSLKFKHIKIILLFFTAGIVVSTLFSMSYFFGMSPGNIFNFAPVSISDIREISIFISHIRFSLLINIAIFSLLYFLIFPDIKSRLIVKGVYIIVIIWLISFLFILQALTGVIIFFITGMILFASWIKKHPPGLLKTSSLIFLISVPIIILSYLAVSIYGFSNIEEPDIQNLDKTTSSGNPYWHDLNNKQIENKDYIGLYICESELKEEWNNISEIKYSGKDLKGQEIKYTLIRYLTSLGLRKDANGVRNLQEKDIKLIEEGYANHIYANKWSFKAKIYQIIWQVDVYNKGGNPSGHSLTQRIEYLKASFGIIGENFLLGVGTGDLQESFNSEYVKMKSKLNPEWRLRAHNQFISFIIAFGIIGFLWILFAFIKPIFHQRKQNDYFFMMFFIVAVLSMLNEDTLEIQAGAGFFAFFYSLFLFGYKRYYITETDDESGNLDFK